MHVRIKFDILRLCLQHAHTQNHNLLSIQCHYQRTRLTSVTGALKPALKKLCPDLTNITVDVEGRSGDCVLTALGGKFRDRLGNAVSARDSDYDLIIILGGTNDLAYKLEKGLPGAAEIFDKGLRVLYEYVLEETRANLLVMTVPMRAIDVRDSSWGGKARESREHLNNLILSWAGKQNGRVFSMDLAKLVPFPKNTGDENEEEEDDDDVRFGGGSCWSADGLHMSEKGYDTVGEHLAEAIQGLLTVEEDS